MSQEQNPAQREAALKNLQTGRDLRGATKHGVFSVVKSGGAELPTITGAAAIAGDVDEALAQIARDLGGDLTGAQKEVLRACRVPMIVLRLAEAYLISNDVMDKRHRPRGILRILASYSNVLRHNLVALGLERKMRDAGDLEAYIETKYPGEERADNESQEAR